MVLRIECLDFVADHVHMVERIALTDNDIHTTGLAPAMADVQIRNIT